MMNLAAESKTERGFELSGHRETETEPGKVAERTKKPAAVKNEKRNIVIL